MITHPAIARHRESRPQLSGIPKPLNIRFGQNRKFFMDGYFLKLSLTDGKVFDICEREEMASIFGHLLNIPVVRAWSSLTDGIVFPSGTETLCNVVKCVIMDWIDGNSLLQDKTAAETVVRSQIQVFADIFAYMQWIGDDDRGLEDIMMVGNKLLLVDNGLTGPPTIDSPLRSAHPGIELFAHNPIQVLKRCVPSKPSFVAFVMRDLRVSCDELKHPDFIDRCVALHSDDLHGIIEGLGMQPSIANVLDSRRQTLRDEYHEWIEKLRLAKW